MRKFPYIILLGDIVTRIFLSFQGVLGCKVGFLVFQEIFQTTCTDYMLKTAGQLVLKEPVHRSKSYVSAWSNVDERVLSASEVKLCMVLLDGSLCIIVASHIIYGGKTDVLWEVKPNLSIFKQLRFHVVEADDCKAEVADVTGERCYQLVTL